MTDSIVIIDYDAGNLRSVQRACAEAGAAAVISNDPQRVLAAERVIFPGVGAAGSAMRSLRRTGLDAALRQAVDAGKPVLGICLGLQISLDHSEEQNTPTLGLIPGATKRFRLDRPELKVPHMGWNEVRPVRAHPLLEGIAPGMSSTSSTPIIPHRSGKPTCTPWLLTKGTSPPPWAKATTLAHSSILKKAGASGCGCCAASSTGMADAEPSSEPAFGRKALAMLNRRRNRPAHGRIQC